MPIGVLCAYLVNINIIVQTNAANKNNSVETTMGHVRYRETMFLSGHYNCWVINI